MKSIAILIPTDYWNIRPVRGNGPSHRSLPDILTAPRGYGKVVCPEDEVSPEHFSGLVIPGGADIDPAFYGQTASCEVDVSALDPAFDRFQLEWTRRALDLGQPMLGICRGLQVMNVAAGGTLIQHVANHFFPEQRRHHIHGLRQKAGSHLARLLDSPQLQVNSVHHQALDRVAEGFAEVAWAPDGVIEAIENQARPWQRGVQFHPEDLSESLPFQRLFDDLLSF